MIPIPTYAVSDWQSRLSSGKDVVYYKYGSYPWVGDWDDESKRFWLSSNLNSLVSSVESYPGINMKTDYSPVPGDGLNTKFWSDEGSYSGAILGIYLDQEGFLYAILVEFDTPFPRVK